jgi:hypothetical protein
LNSAPAVYLAFWIIRIGYAGIYRANFGAFGRIEEADALGALGRVYLVGGFAFADSLIGAFRFAGSTANTLVCNLVSHLD